MSIWSGLTTLLHWIYRSPQPLLLDNINNIHEALNVSMDTADAELISTGWEWVLSTAEQVISKQHQERLAEISSLKKLSMSVSYRSLILKEVTSFYSLLSADVGRNLLDSRLDGSLRNGILRDCINKYSRDWNELVIQMVLRRLLNQNLIGKNVDISRAAKLRADINNSWSEEKYQKNILGELKASTFQASNGAEVSGLTPKILTDITWTLVLGLSRVIGPSTRREIEILMEGVAPSLDYLVELWTQTNTHSSSSLMRVGRLPAQWIEDEQKKAQKSKNAIAARFNDGPLKDALMVACQFKDCQKRLAKHFEFQYQQKVRAPEAQEQTTSFNFDERKENLSKLLFGHVLGC